MGERLWTRDFFALTMANGLLFTSFYFLMPTMPMYAADIGANGTQVGIIGGIFSYSAILIRLFTDNFKRQFGKRICLYLGLMISIAVTASFLIFDAIDSVIAARFIHGFGFGLSTTFAAALAVDIIPAKRRGEGIGYFGLGSTVGMAIAPALGIIVYENCGAAMLFGVSIVCCISAVASVYACNAVERKENSGRSAESITSRFIERGTERAAVLTVLFSAAYGSVNTFIAMMASEAGIDNVSLFFVIGTGFLFLSRPLGGRLFDSRGAFITLLPGAISYSIALILIIVSNSFTTLMIAAIFHGLGAGLLLPSLMTFMINNVKADRRASASATFYNMLDIGTGTGVVILGSLAGFIGYVDIYNFVVVMMVLFIALLMRAHRRHRI